MWKEGKKWVEAPFCPYCGARASLVRGPEVYPHRADLSTKRFWKCSGGCDAFVGCHPKTREPLGRLADKELREAKMAAHRFFDPMWQSELVTRTMAYRILAHLMDLPPEETHIGKFDVGQCKKAIEACMLLTLDFDQAQASGRKARIHEIIEKLEKGKDNEQEEGSSEEGRCEDRSSP